MGINIGDILVTLICFVCLILIISLVIVFIKRVFSSKKQSQIINQKLDNILEKLEEKEQVK
ncbi:DUF4083 family protein [Rummeliibacillus pycnus]|uniref:DUF4083 family protein n=1 Tax=Rummeliibacillus pycnus TaxID=101070 RepID=UPI0037CA4BE5